jgi:putative DNA primase/helicase
MTASKLHAAGFTDLVSVIPPDGKLSPGSKIDPSQRGKCPGKLGPSGWYGYAFTKETVGAEQIDSWGANVGLLGTHFPALDIDVDDEELSQALLKLARESFGAAPVRRSTGSRRLLLFRTEEPFSRIRLQMAYEGEEHAVELLGEGRQYVVHGVHPSGEEYRWEGTPLWDEPLTEIPLIKRQDVLDFFDHLTEKLAPYGVTCTIQGEGKAPGGDVPPQESLLAPNLNELERVVQLIPNPSTWGWDQMVEMGYAIKAAGGEDADRIFFDWCREWEGGHDPDTDYRNWDSFKGPYRAGWSWLQEKAGVNTAQEEFSVEAPAPVEDVSFPDSPYVEHTDEWAVHQLLPHVQQSLRYIPGSKLWYNWEGYQWLKNDDMEYERVVRGHLTALAQRLMARAANVGKSEKKPFVEAARRYQSASGIDSVVRLLRAKVATAISAFDTDRYVLNTPAGVYDLKTGAVRESTPEMMLSRSAHLAPEKAGFPLWQRFLEDLTGEDPKLIHYLKKMAGYALTGDVSEKTLWFLWGSDADTGKSTFVRVIGTLLGSYADSVDVSVFVNEKGARVEALARLPGVRLVTATEPSSGHAWDEKRIKAITGGDTIEARFLYGQPFTYDPQFKIVIVGNHEPEIKNVDDAMFRRIHIVPLNRKVPREKQIENLAEILIEREGPQILQWMIDGCVAWHTEGLKPPQAVLRQTEEYRETEDVLSQWLGDECEMEGEVSRQELYTHWGIWCRQRGENPGGLKSFKRKLDAKHLPIENKLVGRRRLQGYSGVSLRSTIEFSPEEV